MNHLNLLDQLQQLDARIEENRRTRQQLAAHLANDQEMVAAQQAFDAASRHEREVRARLQSLELEVKSLDSQIQGVDSRLYSGKLTNPKELSGLERDEEMLKRHKSEVEDRMLEEMAQIEQAESEVATRRTALDLIQKRRAIETAHDRASLQELEANLTQFNAERTQLRAQVPPAELQVYDSLYVEKKGRAVAHIKGSSCATCGFAVPSGLASRAKIGQELVFCVNCGRILIA